MHYVRKDTNWMRQFVGFLFTQHVSGTIMPIIRSTNLEKYEVVRFWFCGAVCCSVVILVSGE